MSQAYPKTAGFVEDALAIQQLIALYSHAFDQGDAEEWAGIFDSNGVWEAAEKRGDQPTIHLRGRDQLIAFCRQRFQSREEGLTYFHHQSGILFDQCTDDQAKTRVMLILTVKPLNQPPYIFRTGVYFDKWIRTVHGWRLAHRLLTQ